jgi:polyketide cyclase/dehydrase/lipid transport protein
MPAYSFLTTWCVAAGVQDVWDVVSASDRYPEWWKGVRSVTELEPGGENGVGALSRFEWRSKLPYSLRFDMRVTRSQPPHLIEAHVSGELVGVGIWRLYESPAGTALVYSWNVSTARTWMNRLAPVGRPIFVWNHDHVMRQGARGLADRLGVELVAHG